MASSERIAENFILIETLRCLSYLLITLKALVLQKGDAMRITSRIGLECVLETRE
jgi:hypothetical protein